MKEEIRFHIDEVDTGCCLTEKQIKELTNRLHKAFIQAQIKLLQELKGEREWLRDAYSDRTCYAVETREFDKRIVHLTKLLEDE